MLLSVYNLVPNDLAVFPIKKSVYASNASGLEIRSQHFDIRCMSPRASIAPGSSGWVCTDTNPDI